MTRGKHWLYWTARLPVLVGGPAVGVGLGADKPPYLITGIVLWAVALTALATERWRSGSQGER